MFVRLTLVLALVASCPTTRCAAQAPDVILHHGKIVTVDGAFTIAEAMAVKSDQILAVGSNADIQKQAGPATRVIDLQGRTVLPGLIDSHVHPGASMSEFDHPVPDMETVADVLDYIRARAATKEPGQWVNLSQIFITRLREQRYPTRDELDRAAPENPVVFATGPDASVNSLALKLAGIDRDFQPPAGSTAFVERDPETGEPTGVIRKYSELIKVGDTGSRKPTDSDRYTRMKALLADYNKNGITSISDRGANESSLSLFQELKGKGELTCRVYAYHSFNSSGSLEGVEQRLKDLANHPLHEYDNMLWLRGIKLHLDGGMLTGSAYMRKPWGVSSIYSITDPQYRGIKYIDDERLYHVARLALANRLQVTAHSVGDGAVHALIDAYERVNRADFPVREHRPCITHCNFMSAEAINKMAALGIVADLQPIWLYLDGATLLKQFGEQRTEYFQPCKTIFDKGVVVGSGSDHMQKIGGLRAVNPYNPFLGMWTALTRQPRWTDQPLHPEQRISREQALRLYTVNNAFLSFEEQEKGSLEAGKLADFIVLNEDFLDCPVNVIKDITVRETWLGGKVVYAQ